MRGTRTDRLKARMKKCIKIVIGIVIILAISFGMIGYLSQFHLDLSQDYRNVEGYEDIVFKE